MNLYPVFLSLAGRTVLVAGAGTVGRRKLAALREADAAVILVFDPGLSDEEARELASTIGARVFRRPLEGGDIAGCALVFAATGDRAENERIAALCTAANIFCNTVDDPAGSTFHVPAHTRVGSLTAAFSTGGQSPALAARIRKDAEGWLAAHYGPLLVFMGRLRPLVLALGEDSGRNRDMFRALVNSGLGDALGGRDGDAARAIARNLLPKPLHCRIEELLYGLC